MGHILLHMKPDAVAIPAITHLIELHRRGALEVVISRLPEARIVLTDHADFELGRRARSEEHASTVQSVIARHRHRVDVVITPVCRIHRDLVTLHERLSGDAALAERVGIAVPMPQSMESIIEYALIQLLLATPRQGHTHVVVDDRHALFPSSPLPGVSIITMSSLCAAVAEAHQVGGASQSWPSVV